MVLQPWVQVIWCLSWGLLFSPGIMVAAEHLWLLWMSVSVCQEVLPAQFFRNWKCLFSWIRKAHTLTQNKCEQTCRNKSFFLISNISLVSAVTGTAVSMPPSPCRRRDRRHPIMNTRENKDNLPSLLLLLSPTISYCVRHLSTFA